MSKQWFPKVSCAVVLAALVLMPLSGCGGGDGDDGGPAQALNVAGAWSLNAVGMFPMTLNLTHAGTAVGGTVADAENYAVRITGSTAASAGSTEGSRAITLIVTFSDGQVATFSGDVAGDNNSMEGGYVSNWGGEDGWSASR